MRWTRARLNGKGQRGLLLRILTPLLFFLPTLAQNEPIDYTTIHEERTARAVRIEGPIVIDGRFDEPDWERAEPISGFTQKIPVEGAPATEDTEIRLIYDQENLYVGILCHDSQAPGGIIVNDITEDFYTLDSDGIQIVLDTYNDNRNSFLFATNPAAGKFDMQIRNDGNTGNTQWDGVWFVETQITSEGWQAEIAIPFKTLRFRDLEEQVWGLNFERRVRRKFEDSYWAPLPNPYRLGRVSLAGDLVGIRGIEQGRNLQIKPYVSGPVTRRENDDVDFMPDVGLDIKYGLTSQLTLDGTLNTDFSQVEVDEEQINLTRFSLFFPEKRDFFLENAGIFEVGNRRAVFRRQRDVIPFFSRRIGLSQDGRIIPILGGARLTGRAGGYALGLLNIQTREARGEPATNFTVTRIRRDLFTQSEVGGIFINKSASGGDFNRTYGVDGNFTFFRYLDISSYFIGTDSEGVATKENAGSIEVSWVDNFLQLQTGHLRIGENFNPEVGFAPRRGIHKTFGQFGFTSRPEGSLPWARELRPALQYDYITDEEGELETRVVEGEFELVFNDSSRFELEVETSFERLDEPFEIREGQTIGIGDYEFNRTEVGYETDRSRLFSGEVSYGTGGFFDGDRDLYGAGLTIKPSYKLAATAQWERNEIDLPGGAFSTDLIATRVDYSFTNRMFFNALIQYNSETKEVLSNLRFNFIHRPLSDFFLVYNERRDSTGEVIDWGVTAKLTYMLAF